MLRSSLAAIATAIAVLLVQPSPQAAPTFAEWSTPVNLSEVVNSASNEQLPALSKDGLSLYFTSNRPGGFGGQDVWVSQRADVTAPWGPPFNVGPAVNSAFNDNAPAFSRDGHWMFFHSTRPDGFGGFDLMASWRPQVHDDFGWQTSFNLGPAVNGAFNDAGPAYLEDGEHGTPQLYFGSNRPGVGGFDIYVADFSADGTLGAARLVAELSSLANEKRPVIRFDGREMFFFSSRPGSRNEDIWTSTRATVHDPWTPPVNVTSVNSEFNDAQCALSSDARTLIISSDRSGGVGGIDLWVSTRGK